MSNENKIKLLIGYSCSNAYRRLISIEGHAVLRKIKELKAKSNIKLFADTNDKQKARA